MIGRILAVLLLVTGLRVDAQAPPAQRPLATVPAATPAAGSVDGSADAPGPIRPPSGRELTAADAEAWLDGVMPYALGKADIAGGVVVIVKDGRVLLQKGFGVRDVASGAKVDPARTLFRPGSISKLFIWTAVMQLVEQGKIGLDVDINTYLDFKIPPRDGKPITMRHLMTHTPGFEEALKNLITAAPATTSLGAAVKRWTPRRVFAAGTTPAYSNYGVGLAGYIVERVSGRSIDDYVEARIFRPLGMGMSSFRQPLPPALAAQLSKGYKRASEPAQPFEYVAPAPAGSLSATGADMARFMIAHLQGGRLGEAQILAPATARLMHDSRLSLMAPLNGIALGFYEQNINGHRVIAHGGDTQWFHSNLSLFLDDNVGLYVSLNSAGLPNNSVRQLLFEGFADRYFPAPRTVTARVNAETAAQHAAMIAGSYISARGAYSSFMAMAGVIGQLKAVVNADGTISLPALLGPAGVPKRYRETSPFLWTEVGGHDRIGAIIRDGAIVRISSDMLSGVMVFDRAPPMRSASWLVPAAGVAAAALVLTVLLWPVRALVRRRFAAPFPYSGQQAHAYRWSRRAGLVAVLALAAWGAVIATISAPNGLEIGAGMTALIVAASVLTLVGLGGGLLAAAYNLYVTWSTRAGWAARLWSVVLLLAFAVLLWFAHVAGLLSFATDF